MDKREIYLLCAILGIVIIAVGVGLRFMNMEALSDIATLVLAVAAIFAGILAIHNIKTLREQNRRNTFLKLMVDISESRSRDYRAILHKIFDKWREKGESPSTNGIYTKRIADFFIGNGGGPHIWKEDSLIQGDLRNIYCKVRDELKFEDTEANKEFRSAFEETIALFDRVGFFLLYSDSLLRKEAPDWIWNMTYGMWIYLGEYVEQRQRGKETDHNYAIYFKKLANIAKDKRNQP